MISSVDIPTNCHLYHYAGNNPVRYVDPDGRHATYTIDRENKTVNITSSIIIYGDGATAEVAEIYQRGINAVWGGTYSTTIANETYTVSITATVTVGTRPESISDDDAQNYIEVNNTSNTSNVLSGHLGEWRANGRDDRSLEQDNPAIHEFGHLLGLRDRYQATYDEQGVRTSTRPAEGWEDNIMGRTGGVVDQRNIDSIMQRIQIDSETNTGMLNANDREL